ncbi:hypothetical protein CAPTEDRAFT_221032 [Capitella teleta]|uniref:BTB domain-containing protein n=1 Tax=Capitella teleta TaxID=283909 RepID=R7V917_CAPTE|nr:hypothetical protein CAPTEDRAFT_221032 [Capitella teleta]|eukprot:ELU15064.1 hypothetical protein CAPTEDRAFT_221032 [Capitella teleta]
MLSSLPDFCYDLYKKGQLVDLTLTCANGERLLVHSVVLALKSKVIQEVLLHLGDLTQVTAVVHCGDVDVQLLRSLVEFAYTAEFEEEAYNHRDTLLFVAKRLGLEAAVRELDNQKMALKRKSLDAEQMKAVNVSAQLKCKSCEKTFVSARQCKRHACEVKVEVVNLSQMKHEEVQGHDDMVQIEQRVAEDNAAEEIMEEEETNQMPEAEEQQQEKSEEEKDEEVAEMEVEEEKDEMKMMKEEPVKGTKHDEQFPEKKCKVWRRSHTQSLPFKCPHCTFSTSKAPYLSDHTRVRHPNAPETCPHCQEVFSRKEIGRHKKGCEKRFSDAASVEALFHCDVCPFTAIRARYISDHTRKMHGGDSVLCVHCGQQFQRREIHRHQQRCKEKPAKVKVKVVYETDENALKCPVKDCEFVAEDREQKLLHAQTEHKVIVKKKAAVSEETFVCEHCGRTMNSKAAHRAHMAAVHSTVFHPCSMCEYQGKSLLALRSHCQLIHSCNPDGSPYERRFACTVCDFKAIHRCTLKTHMKKHESKKAFTCDHCPYKTHRKDSLLKHKSTMHTTSRRVKVCRTCGKAFVSETGFRMHNLRHLGLRPYHCTLCNLPFARLSTFELHNMRKHPTTCSQSPLSCTHCSYTCSAASTLKQHYRTKHGISDVHIVGSRKGRRSGHSSFKNRFKEFNNVNQFVESNTIVGKVEDNSCVVDEEELQQQAAEEGEATLEMHEASEILAGIGTSSQVEVEGTVEVASTPTVYEVNGQTIAVYYV